MRSHKISFIVTIYNEQRSINTFLTSLYSQTVLPNEIIIVDGGSTDKTVKLIKKISKKFENKNIRFTLLVKKGNRSIGRNEAVKNATGDIILCSDAGNILDKNWVSEISKPFKTTKVDVVAGYYKGKATNIFQKCLIPYALVMEDKVNPNDFLPATRSVAFRKSLWKRVGGFNELLSHNEDYIFALKLKEAGAKIVFAKNALVHWIPRNSYKDAFIMFFRFAFGDAEAKILRFKVFLLFARYFLGFYIVGLSILYQSLIGINIMSCLVMLYLLYSGWKNYKYVNEKKGFFILINLQLVADSAVLLGSILGVIKRLSKVNVFRILKQNRFLVGILLLYVLLMIITLRYGIPNQNHPFPYNMDEWHQLQAVRATAKFGTPNIFGAANGTMLHFMLSVLYLIPFTLLDYINPAVLKVNDLFMRERIFELLRINTILYGVFTLVVFNKLLEQLHLSKRISLVLFMTTPLWLFISGYFKYDIAVLFWSILTIYFLIKFSIKSTFDNYIYAAIIAGLAFSTKVSAISLFPLLLFAFILFYPKWYQNIKIVFISIVFYFLTILLFGSPDTLFGKGNFFFYFYENVITSPTYADNFTIGTNANVFIFTQQFPLIYGYSLIAIFLVACTYILFYALKNGIKNFIVKNKQFLLIAAAFLITVISIIPLKMYGGGNRSIVLLPLIILIIGYAIRLLPRKKIVIFCSYLILGITIVVQIMQTSAWLSTKFSESPQQSSSKWIVKNIPKNSLIGIEPMPLYQGVPEFIEKEYYYNEYNVPYDSMYEYVILDKNTKKLPSIIIITNGEIDAQIYKQSDTKALMSRIKKEGYKRKANFTPDFRYYKYFGNDLKYYLSYMASTPLSISVYTK